MLKKRKYLLFLLLVLSFVLLFVACTEAGPMNEPEKDEDEEEEEIVVDYTNIYTVEVVDPEDLEEKGFLVDEFAVSSIKLLITYYSGDTVEIPASYSMVKAEDKAKLQVAGTHQLTLLYRRFTITFNLKLYRNVVNTYQVSFLDWQGNRLGDVQYLQEGQIATVPNLESRPGYEFVGWQIQGSTQVVNTFSFMSDTTLVATYVPEYYDVDYYYVIGENEVHLSTETIKRGGDAYAVAPPIPIVNGYSNGHWSDVESMKSINDNMSFYAVFDKDYVNATFVYYKYEAGVEYAFDVHWVVSEANEGINPPNDAQRTASDIFLYWYILHDDNEIKVDFPYVLTAETTFYAKYVPAIKGSSGLNIQYITSGSGEADQEGYYITAYDGDDSIIAIPNAKYVDTDVRYVFIPYAIGVGDIITGECYRLSGGYVYKVDTSIEPAALDGISYYIPRIVCPDENDVNFIYLPELIVGGEAVAEDTYYEKAGSDHFTLTTDTVFDAAKEYYIRKQITIWNGNFYLKEKIADGTTLEANKYYYFRDNNYNLITASTKANSRMTYYTKMSGADINGIYLFIKEDNLIGTEEVIYIPENKTKILGLKYHPFADNGAKSFFVANNNTVFRAYNGSLFSADLKTLYAYPNRNDSMFFSVANSEKVPLERIDDYAFYNADILESITLPDTVLSIGDYAFFGCRLVTSVNIPSSVRSIGDYAYSGCASATGIVFADNAHVESLGAYCFSDMITLTSFALPASVTSIGTGVLTGCISLVQLTADSENTRFTVDRNNGGLYGRKEDMLYYYLYAFPSKYDGVSNGIITLNVGARVVCTGAFYYASIYEIAFESKSNTIVFEEGSVVCPTLKTMRFNCTSITMDDDTFTDYDGKIFLPEKFYIGQAMQTQLNSSLSATAFKDVDRALYDADSGDGKASYKPFSSGFGYNLIEVSNGYSVTITAYRGNSTVLSIPSVVDGEPVTVIAENAFRGNKNLTEIIIPDSVKRIEDEAFFGCENLEKVTFGSGVNFIGGRVFAGCPKLRTVISHDRMLIGDAIGLDAFAGTPFLNEEEFVLVGGTLLSYNGVRNDVIVPDNVYVIGESAFKNCVSMTELKFGSRSQLISIGANAFCGCENIVEVTLPSKLHSIAEGAFARCSRLFAVVLTSSVTSQADSFDDTGSVYGLFRAHVIDMTTPKSEYSFDGIADSEGEAYYLLSAPIPSVTNGIFDGWCIDVERLVPASFPCLLAEATTFYAKTISLTDSSSGLVYTRISDGYEISGYTGSEKYIVIPSVYNNQKVVSIGENAFYGQSGLYGFSLPDTIKHIGKNAFFNTSWLNNYTEESIVLGRFLIRYTGVQTEYQLPSNIRYIADGAFENNSYIEIVYCNQIVSALPNNCFSGCSSLTKIVFGQMVTSLGANLFNGCVQLEEIDMSAAKGLSEIDPTAFNGSYWLEHYPDDNVVINKVYYAYLGNNHTVHIPNSLHKVNAYAFYDNANIKYVYIPESILTIGEYAFAKSGLQKVFFADTINSLTTIENHAFYRCRQVIDLDFRSCIDLVSIGDEAFCGVKTLSEEDLLTYQIPAATDTFGERVFAESDVYAVYFSPESNLVDLPKESFYQCEKLVSIRFLGRSDLTYIGNDAFRGCASLKTFAGENALLEEIGDRAFYQCSSLLVFEVNESLLSVVGNDAFTGTGYVGTTETMVMIGSVLAKYNGIQSIVYIPENVTEISGSAFEGNERISQVEFAGNNLRSIRYFAFRDCTSITQITLPSSVENIEEGAFAGCRSLSSIFVDSVDTTQGFISQDGVLFKYYTREDKRYAELFAYPNKHAGVYVVPSVLNVGGYPVAVIGIGAYAFYNDVDLRKIELPQSLLYIDSYAFYGCTGLTTIILPDSVITIGSYAFYSCGSITDVVIGKDVHIIENSVFSHCGALSKIYFPGRSNEGGLWVYSDNDEFINTERKFFYFDEEEYLLANGSDRSCPLHGADGYDVILYSILDPDIASVDTAGTVTGINEGTTTLLVVIVIRDDLSVMVSTTIIVD